MAEAISATASIGRNGTPAGPDHPSCRYLDPQVQPSDPQESVREHVLFDLLAGPRDCSGQTRLARSGRSQRDRLPNTRLAERGTRLSSGMTITRLGWTLPMMRLTWPEGGPACRDMDGQG